MDVFTAVFLCSFFSDLLRAPSPGDAPEREPGEGGIMWLWTAMGMLRMGFEEGSRSCVVWS